MFCCHFVFKLRDYKLCEYLFQRFDIPFLYLNAHKCHSILGNGGIIYRKSKVKSNIYLRILNAKWHCSKLKIMGFHLIRNKPQTPLPVFAGLTTPLVHATKITYRRLHVSSRPKILIVNWLLNILIYTYLFMLK